MAGDVHNAQGRDDTQLLAKFPLGLIHAELQRRQDAPYKPPCGTNSVRGTYNTPLHVFALFLILILSTLACSFPIIARRFPGLPIPHRFLFLSRHFGTGVLIATAFVHLLPTAFVSMTDPCLPSFWNKGYPAMPGLIAMVSVFVVVTIEMFFATRGAGHSHTSEWDTIPDDDDEPMRLRGGRIDPLKNPNKQQEPQDLHNANGHAESNHSNGSADPVTPYKPTRASLDPDNSSDLSLDELDPIADESAFLNNPTSSRSHHHPHHHSPSDQNSEPNPQKLFLQCLLLEAGILFHSIFIGMALSVSTGTEFIVLLIAISFHQTFEGLALGSRISALIPALFAASSPKPWLMALAYGTTTPIGQALGLWMHELYDPYSETGLLTVGITNAISSGLLLFAGLVQLLSEDFLSDRSYETLKGRRRAEACVSVACGGILMAIVGAFA